MKLLVSVSCAEEVSVALEGGADIIDAKDPRSGALGAVSIPVLGAIRDAAIRVLPVSAAIGDATDEVSTERIAFEFAATGLSFVKVGFAGSESLGRSEALIAAAVRGATAGGGGRTGVVVVAYADAARDAVFSTVPGTNLAPARHLAIAAHAGARGVLLDTADKSGPGLCALLSPTALAAWVTHAHRCGLLTAVAGRLTAGDLPVVRDAG